MGAWGSNAWDDDLAADWFAELFDETGLAEKVEKTLKIRDVEEYASEIRAAAYVLIALGHNYVWPVDDLDRHLKLAISKLKRIRKLADYEGMPEIDEEIATLEARLEAPNAIDLAGQRTAVANRLRAADPAERLKAAREISREARGGSMDPAVLGESTVTRALTECLVDSDPKVAEEAVIALAEISRKWYRDEYAYPAVVALFRSKSIQTRAWAVQAAGWLRRERSFDDLLPLLNDKAARVRGEVLNMIDQIYQDDRPDAATAARLVEAIKPLEKDKDAEVRSAAKALRKKLKPTGS